MDKLTLKNNGRSDVIIEGFDVDNEISFSCEYSDKDITIYFTADEVLSIIDFLEKQMKRLNKL